MNVSEILDGLDAEQRRAATDASARLLVAAPPGSGKTRVLASALALRLTEGAEPEKILAVTFTNRAARELRERVAGMTEGSGVDAASLNITTFHGFCLGFLRANGPDFTLYGRADQVRVLTTLGVKDPDKAAARISEFKNFPGMQPPSGEFTGLLNRYAERLRAEGALDLDDLIPRTSAMLEDARSTGLFDFVFIDEYQDINPAQTHLVRLLARGSRLAAIGDPDQSIYGFRGSTPESFSSFADDFSGASVVELKRNYRSGAAIVEGAAGVISRSSGRACRPMEAVRAGGRLVCVSCPDEKAEAEFITAEIERLMGGLTSLTSRAESECSSFADFAVLARTNRGAEELADAFRRSSIPFQLIGPVKKRLRAFASTLRSLTVPEGRGPAAFILEAARESGCTDDEINTLAHELDSIGTASPAVMTEELIERLLVRSPADDFAAGADKVAVMTMHMTKGLEFDTVFITGAEDGLVPLRLKAAECDYEEERRLFYVAMTRARERLYISSARKRRLWGAVTEPARSPFVAEIPVRVADTIDIARKRKVRKPVQKGLF